MVTDRERRPSVVPGWCRVTDTAEDPARQGWRLDRARVRAGLPPDLPSLPPPSSPYLDGHLVALLVVRHVHLRFRPSTAPSTHPQRVNTQSITGTPNPPSDCMPVSTYHSPVPVRPTRWTWGRTWPRSLPGICRAPPSPPPCDTSTTTQTHERRLVLSVLSKRHGCACRLLSRMSFEAVWPQAYPSLLFLPLVRSGTRKKAHLTSS